MDLWIRSQDGKLLTKVQSIGIYQNHFGKGFDIGCGFSTYATYKKEARAMQVLNEIQNKIKGKYLMEQKSDVMFDGSTIEKARQYFENLNEISLISGDSNFDIVPINNEIVIYQMPKE